MRRLASTALLVLLAACTVTTTGAPCSSDLECPSDQGCGNDGRCGTAALDCPGHGTAGECRPGTSCADGQLITCTAGSGVCSTGPVATDCPAHQECQSTGASASCACSATRCSGTTSAFCSTGGLVVTCAQDGAGAGCWYEATSTACGDPGAACVESGGSAACDCPLVDACTDPGATRCTGFGTQVQACQPVVSGSSCLTWQVAVDCAPGGLVCRAGACACPDNPGTTFVADAGAGSPAGSAPGPTGVDSPAACRYRSLADALGAAGARGPGATVLARGWSASGGKVVFREPGALAVSAGVALVTDDAPPDPSHYAATTAAALPGAFVTLGPGASLSGFEIQTGASTGPGVATRCPAATDLAAVSLTAVSVSGASTGTPDLRFANGLHASGHCPVSVTGGGLSGATTGLLAEAETAAPTTMTGGSVTGNGTGVDVRPAGATAPSLSATGTTFRSNAGDAVLVEGGAFSSDACPYVDNGTHVHARPLAGAPVGITVRNSTGTARMTGATDSAFRLLAMGSGSAVSISNCTVTGNGATQSYNVASGMRRGGGVVFTAPFPATVSLRGNAFYANGWDQVLVAASADALDLGGDPACGSGSNVFACYDAANLGVGLYSNGAAVNAAWNHWTRQPGVYSIDVGGSGVTGYDTSACSPAAIPCP